MNTLSMDSIYGGGAAKPAADVRDSEGRAPETGGKNAPTLSWLTIVAVLVAIRLVYEFAE